MQIQTACVACHDNGLNSTIVSWRVNTSRQKNPPEAEGKRYWGKSNNQEECP